METSLTVWPGKSGPKAEIITVQIRHLSGDRWETVGRLVAYRTLVLHFVVTACSGAKSKAAYYLTVGSFDLISYFEPYAPHIRREYRFVEKLKTHKADFAVWKC